MDVINRLKNISLFTEFKDNSKYLEQIAAIVKIEKFPANKYIIKEGDVGNKMYILNSGSVRVEKFTLEKEQFTVVNLKDDMNVFFGEVALMDNDVRSASVYSITAIECFVIKKEDFEKLCDDNNTIGYYITKEIAKSLSYRLRKVTNDNVNLIAALIND